MATPWTEVGLKLNPPVSLNPDDPNQGLLGSNAVLGNTWMEDTLLSMGADNLVKKHFPHAVPEQPEILKGATGLFDSLGKKRVKVFQDQDSEGGTPPGGEGGSAPPGVNPNMGPVSAAVAANDALQNPFLGLLSSGLFGPIGSAVLGGARGLATDKAMSLLSTGPGALTDIHGNPLTPDWKDNLAGAFGLDPVNKAISLSLDPFGPSGVTMSDDAFAAMGYDSQADDADPYGLGSHADDPYGGMGDPNAPTDYSMSMHESEFGGDGGYGGDSDDSGDDPSTDETEDGYGGGE
tara:strand:+ start:1565 stop:2440 length:876 start_codon:yes stop_codon:yes gene_type:complete